MPDVIRLLLIMAGVVVLIVVSISRPLTTGRQGLEGRFAVPAPTPPPAPPAAPLPSAGGRAALSLNLWECAGWHAGAIDFCGEQGEVIYVPASGTITAIGAYSDPMRYGAYVIIETSAGLEIYVGHLNHETVNPLGLAVGDRVAAGDPIGDLSEFAYSRPHTHVQLRIGGVLVGPEAWWETWEGR